MNYGGGLPNTIKKTYPAPVIKKNNGQGAAGAMGPLYNNFEKVTGGGTPLPVPAKRNTTPSAGAGGGFFHCGVKLADGGLNGAQHHH